MANVSQTFTGGPGMYLTTTCPAADPTRYSDHGTADRSPGNRPALSTLDTRTPDDAFSGTFRIAPRQTGATAGRGGVSRAALPNFDDPEMIAAMVGM